MSNNKSTVRRERPATAGGVSCLLDINQAAERLNVTTRFIRRLIAERRIAHLKIGKFIRFDPVELDRWIDEQRVERSSYEAS